MYLRLGNLTVKQFMEKVGADATEEEIAFLETYRTDQANSSDADKFHIFEHPAISVVMGSKATDETLDTWIRIDSRKTFNRVVSFDRGKA